jgi:tetratricopeptide (TPR) repeat protein
MIKILYICILVSLTILGCGKKQVYQKPETSQVQELKARDHFTKGMFFELENKHENALIEFYQALLYDSSSATIYNRIAENHMALGRYESALRYLQKSVKLKSNEPETVRLIADCHYRLKDDNKAIDNLQKVLELDPFDENARTLLLLLFRKNGNDIGMAEQYEQMINIYGEDEDWVRKAATIYLKNGQINEALSLFELYVQVDSSNAGMWYSVGMTYGLKGESEPALRAYSKALELEPNVTEAAEHIYTICRKDQKWQKLIEIFEPYIDIPNVEIYRLGMADAYISKEDKDYAKSEEILRPLLNEKNVGWQVYELLGRLEWGRKNYGKASDYFQKIIDMDSKNKIGWIFKGFVLSDADSLEAAEVHYKKSLKYLPADSYLLTFYGILLQRLDRDEEAIGQFRKAITADSSHINALVSLGISLNRLNRDEEALIPLERALELDPDNFNALSNLGMLYDELKIYNKCDSLYAKALKLYPENPLFLNNYAYTLAERSTNLEFALTMAEKAVLAEPDNSAYLDTLGWIYYMMGKYNLALIHIKKSVEKREDSAVVVEHLGDVFYKLGSIEDARNQWKRALELEKENKRLKLKIENTQHEM